MLDGVWLVQNAVVVLALGITRKGDKVGLNFEPGACESEPVVKALVVRLQATGFGPISGHQLLLVLDGAKPLENTVRGRLGRGLDQALRNAQGAQPVGLGVEATPVF
jgi:hypothetical protein